MWKTCVVARSLGEFGEGASATQRIDIVNTFEYGCYTHIVYTQGVRHVVKTTSRVRTTPKNTTRKIPAAKVPGKPATRIGEVTSQQLDIDPVTLTPFGTRL